MKLDITFLSAADTPKLKLGWVVYDSEESLQASIKEKEGQEGLDQYLHDNHPDRQLETDKADIYRGSGCAFKRPGKISYPSIEVLPELKGKPWNNEAVNKITTLRPSNVRVTQGIVHLDSMKWRVTVFLEKDDITIRKITQEVECGGYGHGVFTDVSNNPPSAGLAVINDYAISKIIVGDQQQ